MIKLVKFDPIKTKEAIMEINRWGKKATKGLIKNYLPNSAARKELVLIIANALYFKGAWYDPFDEFNTRCHEFYTLDGENTVEVPFMFKGYESLSYASSIGFKILRLPYLNGNEIRNVSRRRFAMYFFLPDEKDGLFNLLDQFSSNPDLLNLQIEFQKTEIRELRIPKFKFTCRFEVSKIMELLGLTMNIKDAEILEGLGEDVPMKNSKIIHNCCIELNECGTEAAADTEDENNMGFSLYDSPPPIDFIADHPFIFMIREEISRTNVFLGALFNPLSQ